MNALVRCACAWALLCAASARRYERCELARDLLRYGVEREHLATWVCIAYHESRFDTAAVNPHSHDYGILQISSLYWCGSAGANVCGVPCSDFLDDDIEDDVRCAQRIFSEHTAQQGDGFMAWVAYSSCPDHHVKKYLADCGDLRKNFTTAAKPRARLIPVAINATYYKNIDQLKPPKFVERALDSGEKYGREPKMRKIDNSAPFKFNIDELKLPVFDRTTTTTITSVITKSTTDTPRSTAAVSTAAVSKFSEGSTYGRTTNKIVTSVPRSSFRVVPTSAVPKFTKWSTYRATTNRIATPVPRPSSTPSTTSHTIKTSSDEVLPYFRSKLPPIQRTTTAPKAALKDLLQTSKESAPSSTEASSTGPKSSTSVFDLYLNTKRPSLSTYSFAPFTGKRYRVQIFSGGTTTPYTPLLGKYLDLDLLKRSSNDATLKHNRYLDEREEPGQEYT